MSANTIVESAHQQNARQVEAAPDAAAAIAAAVAEASPGDTVLMLGAGDVSRLADEVLRRLKAPVATRGGR